MSALAAIAAPTTVSSTPRPGQLRLWTHQAVARGDEPDDLVLANGHVVNVFTGHVGHANVAIKDGRIAGVGPEYAKALECYDLAGQYVLPGFIGALLRDRYLRGCSFPVPRRCPGGTAGTAADRSPGTPR